mgnify:CR=1 FL=1
MLLAMSSFNQINTNNVSNQLVILENGDSISNCYTAITPNDTNISALLFLVPGFGESPHDVLIQTDLPFNAANRGIATIIPLFQNGVESYGFDQESQLAFKRIFDDATTRYNIESDKYFLGGFSMGGAAALKFAETQEVKPMALFMIDSPIDFERFYLSLIRDKEIFGKMNNDRIYQQLLDDVTRIMGGNPYDAKESYYKNSPFSASDSSQAAIQSLGNLPIRYYIEPAIEWWLNERNTDVYGLNLMDATSFINQIKNMGNNKAELIITNDKGYRRPSGQRHPHSWSIVDNDNLLEWMSLYL